MNKTFKKKLKLKSYKHNYSNNNKDFINLHKELGNTIVNQQNLT